VRREFDGGCEPDIRKRPRTDDGGSRRVGTDDARRAGGAVAWRLQFAQKIVMLERCRREEDGVHREPDERAPPTVESRAITS
jgi:hypothetical protein